jgi:energy-coupling factor transport system permease protein
VWQTAYFALLMLPAIAVGALANLWRLKSIAVAIFVLSAVLWTVTLPGTTALATWGPVTVTHEALLLALARAVRLWSFLVAGVVFLTVTSVEEFTYGLRGLGLPFRACFAVTFAFRLTPLFLETAEQIANAQRTRGLDLDRSGLFTRARRFLPLLLPVLVSGFRRADNFALALEAKGFSLPGRRTSLLVFAFSWRDALLLFAAAMLIIGAYFSRGFSV